MTVIINTQEELETLFYKDDDGNIIIADNLEINCDIDISVNIKAWDIKAYNIKARNIKAWNIKAWDIKAKNIKAYNIDAYNIDVHNISYDTFCIASKSLKCKTIEGERKNSIHTCLDQPIKYIK